MTEVAATLDSLLPIVLVGGRSTRFGRDKLREPVEGGWLVDLPVRVLREVFGARVTLVGECDAEVAARGDAHVPDRHPGLGPLGGILTALEATKSGVFVLAGDIPRATPEIVRLIVERAGESPGAMAVLATTTLESGETRAEPCLGVYRTQAAPVLREALERGERSLQRLLVPLRAELVPVASPGNVNTPDDL